MTERNRDDVLSVCRRLDGMPLAIELAVVRLRVLPLGELAARLEHRFEARTGGRRSALPRHQTLRAAIDWSHDLCTVQEQLLWRRLSVFAGDFDVTAVEAVCESGELSADGVLEQLIGLVDKSVVLRADEGRAHYRLLDTLREYGAERLAGSGEEQTYRSRHFTYFESVASAADNPFHSNEQAERLTALARGELDQAHLDLGEARCRLRALGDRDGLGIACFIQTFGAAVTGDTAHAWEVSGEGLEALRDAPGECWTRSYCLLCRQLALWMSRDASRAEERDRLGREALDLKLAVGDRLGTGIALELLAWSAAECGRPARAAWLLGAAEELWEKIGGARFNAEVLHAEHHTAVATVRRALDEQQYEMHHARGRALDLAEAVAGARDGVDALPAPPPPDTPGAPASLDGRPRQQPAKPPSPPSLDQLTRREREVAALIAEGLTNREIADRLVISKRTADAHVEHIRTKLGFTSRAQIAGLD